MKKILGILAVFMLCISFANAQQNYYKFRLGLGVGFNSYYGDLSHRFFKQSNIELAYSAHAEFNFNKTTSLRISGIGGSFSADDRKYEKSVNFDRALNFKTHILGGDVMLAFYTDNGKLFKENAIFAPYFFVGAGAMKFDVFADLYDENGQRYYYWSDGTTRNISEYAPNASSAEIIEKNGVYETALRPLRTEKPQKYKEYAFYIPFGMGFKFRLGDRMNLNIESKFNYSLNDYIDDVAGRPVNPNLTDPEAIYAANPNNEIVGSRGNTKFNKFSINDIFIYTSASLYVNFGKKKREFNAPFIYAPMTASKDSTSKKYRLNKKLQREIDSLNRLVAISTLDVEKMERKRISGLEVEDYAKNDSLLKIEYSLDSTPIEKPPLKLEEGMTIIVLDSAGNPIDTTTFKPEIIRTFYRDSLVLVDSLSNTYKAVPVPVRDSVIIKKSLEELGNNLPPVDDERSSAETESIEMQQEYDSLRLDSVRLVEKMNRYKQRLDSIEQQKYKPLTVTPTLPDTIRSSSYNNTPVDTVYKEVRRVDTVYINAEKTIEEKVDTVYLNDKKYTPKVIKIDTIYKNGRTLNTQDERTVYLNNESTLTSDRTQGDTLNVKKYVYLSPEERARKNKEEEVVIVLPEPDKPVKQEQLNTINEVNEVKARMDSVEDELVKTINARNNTAAVDENRRNIEALNQELNSLQYKFDSINFINYRLKSNQSTYSSYQDEYVQAKIDEAINKYEAKLNRLKLENQTLENELNAQKARLNEQEYINQKQDEETEKKFEENEEEKQRLWKRMFGNPDGVEKKKTIDSNTSNTPSNSNGQKTIITSGVKDTVYVNNASADNKYENAKLKYELEKVKTEGLKQESEINALKRKLEALENASNEPKEQAKEITSKKNDNIGKVNSVISSLVLKKNMNVFFGNDKTSVSPKFKAEITNFVNDMNLYEDLKLNLSGYASKVGNAVYNDKISRERVKNVQDFIVNELGIDASRIFTRYYGSEGGYRYSSQELNRRVELTFTKD